MIRPCDGCGVRHFLDPLIAFRTHGQELASFRAVRLNQGTHDTEQNFLLDPDSRERCETRETENLPRREGQFVLGLDLGGSAAFSAAAAYWYQSGRIEFIQACGTIPTIEKRESGDHVPPGFYQRMKDAGELLTLGQRVVPTKEFLSKALHLFGWPGRIACDRYRIDELRPLEGPTLENLPSGKMALSKVRPW